MAQVPTQTAPAHLSGEVEYDEVYIVAGHKGQSRLSPIPEMRTQI
jgi:hypothetical protein